jgi:hypothetical protein
MGTPRKCRVQLLGISTEESEMAGKSCAISIADAGEAYLSMRLRSRSHKTKEAHEPVRLARKQR